MTNFIPTPAAVAANRTARLVSESKTPVYSTETPAPKEREHIIALEVESDMGRYWVHVKESEVDATWAEYEEIGYWASDQDHSGKCWCSYGNDAAHLRARR